MEQSQPQSDELDEIDNSGVLGATIDNDTILICANVSISRWEI